jgi:hypothetical protein
MKLRGRHWVIALIALALGALPAYAQSGSPFTDSRDAAARQYDVTVPTVTTTATTTTTTTTGTTTSTGTPVGPSGQLVTPQSEGTPTTGTTPTTSTPTETASGDVPAGGSGEGNAPNAGGGNAPVKVTPAVKAKAKGTLPFTGRDLTIFVLIALALILAGTLLAIAERKTRNRRSSAAG